MIEIELSKEDMENICKLYFLQTLLLLDCSIEEIPKKIENSVQVRKLDLSKNDNLKVLPESMCSLLQLQTLNVEGCSNLCRLPKGIHRLQNLKHLNVDGAIFLLPQGIGQLRGLRTLIGKFETLCGRNKLELLKKLNRLIGSLTLVINDISSTSELEELVKDAGETELKNKEHLQKLKIQFQCCHCDGKEQSLSLWFDVIEALEPNNNLKYLEIDGYKGQRLPRWVSSPLCLLREIVLTGFSLVSPFPPVGKLPLLETLDMLYMKELKVVGLEWMGIECSSSSSATNVIVVFPKLKKLKFWGCKWEEWEDITAEEEESTALHIMPSLTHLHIEVSSGLMILPHRLLRKARSLQVLDISSSPELIICYGDKDGDPWRSISQSHPQLQLFT